MQMRNLAISGAWTQTHSGMAFSLAACLMMVLTLSGSALLPGPLWHGEGERPLWSEAIANIGTIRTCLRLYAEKHGGQYPILSTVSDTELKPIGLTAADLDGKYFKSGDYSVISTATTYVISVRANSANGWGPSEAGKTLAVNNNGVSSGTAPLAVRESLGVPSSAAASPAATVPAPVSATTPSDVAQPAPAPSVPESQGHGTKNALLVFLVLALIIAAATLVVRSAHKKTTP